MAEQFCFLHCAECHDCPLVRRELELHAIDLMDPLGSEAFDFKKANGQGKPPAVGGSA